MTLCEVVSALFADNKRVTYHFESPNSSDPDLQFAGDTLNIVEFDTFPPASASRFAPK